MSRVLKLRLKRGQSLVNQVRLVVGLQVLGLVVGGVLVLHHLGVVAGCNVGPVANVLKLFTAVS
jgi:hypothetical protein